MIYWTPDLHIAKNLKKSCSLTRDDSYRALDMMTSLILKDSEAEAVILPGDIFNTNHVNGRSIAAFLSMLDKFAERNIRVYSIQGNHDRDEQESIPAAMGALSIDRKLVKIGDTRIYGLDYRKKLDLKEYLAKVPPCDVLVLHGAYSGFCTLESMIDYSTEDIPEHVRNLFSGHLHTSEIISLRDKGWAVSAGVLHPCAVDQTRGQYIYKWQKGMTEWERIAIPGRKIFRRHLSLDEDLDEITETIKATEDSPEESRPIMEMTFLTDYWSSIKDLQTQYAAKYIFFEKPFSYGKLLDGNIENEELCDKISLKEALPFALDPIKYREEYRLLDELLDTKTPDNVIQNYLADEELCSDEEMG